MNTIIKTKMKNTPCPTVARKGCTVGQGERHFAPTANKYACRGELSFARIQKFRLSNGLFGNGLLLLLFIAQSLYAQTGLIPAPTSFENRKGTFQYTEASAKHIRTTLSPAIGKNASDEAYQLEVTPDSIFINASSEKGAFYAREAIKQLARNGQDIIRCCRIYSSPRYSWRGFMLDESRHFFGKEKVKQYLDIMASLHLNVFHWHLTDEPAWRIEIKKYPRLTQVGAIGNWDNAKAPAQFYTQDEVREIVAYAAERNIMVIPEFDMPGHATAVCRAYPEVSGGGEGRWKHFTFHPCKEETYRFISDVLDEIVSLFPAPYIHIGGDEVHYGNQSWFTDPDIQRFIQEKELVNETGLEHYFIRRAANLVASKGKKVIGWDEIVDAGVPPSQALVMWWRHDKKSQLVKALENGYQVVLTPRRPLYGDFVQDASHKIGRYWDGYNPLEDVYAFPEPISHLFKGYEDQILGMQFTLWTERIADTKRLDFMTFPRLVAVAESAWSPLMSKSWSHFSMRLPSFLEYLKEQGIFYFDFFSPKSSPEPHGPSKADVLQNG